MPNPFSKQTDGGRVETPGNDIVAVLNSVLVCMYCFHESSEGSYYPNRRVLTWICDGCGETNVVREIDL